MTRLVSPAARCAVGVTLVIRTGERDERKVIMVKYDEIDICGACLTIVDGDPSMGDKRTQAECKRAARGMAEIWDHPDYQIHGMGSENGEGSFSRSACEGCGNRHHGTRFPAVVLVPEGSPLAVGA